MLQCDMLQINCLDKDNDGLRDENNRLATLLAERQPLVDRLHATVDALQEVAPPGLSSCCERDLDLSVSTVSPDPSRCSPT